MEGPEGKVTLPVSNSRTRAQGAVSGGLGSGFKSHSDVTCCVVLASPVPLLRVLLLFLTAAFYRLAILTRWEGDVCAQPSVVPLPLLPGARVGHSDMFPDT